MEVVRLERPCGGSWRLIGVSQEPFQPARWGLSKDDGGDVRWLVPTLGYTVETVVIR